MTKFKRQPTAGDVARALRLWKFLCAPPEDLGRKKTAPAGTGKRLQESTDTQNYKPARVKRRAAA